MTESPPEPDQDDEEYPASDGPASDVGADANDMDGGTPAEEPRG